MSTIARQYCPLATLTPTSINLQQQALYILQQYDFCIIVTLQGNSSILEQNPTTMQGIHNSKQIWISKSPMYSTHLKRYILILRVWDDDSRIMAVAHSFCSLISHVVALCQFQNVDLGYLLAPTKMIQERKGAVSTKIGVLIGISEDNQANQARQSNQKLKQTLQSQQISEQLLSQLYLDYTGYQIRANSPPQQHLYPLLQNLTQSRIHNQTILTHGQVITCYAIILAEQFNQNNFMMPSDAEDQIQVDQFFDDYLFAVDKYNNKCKNSLASDGDGDLEGQLRRVRGQIQGEDLWIKTPHYAKKMGRYMDRKQQQLSRLNQQFSDSFNLNLLQRQSSKSLQTLTSTKTATQADINRQLNRVITRYNEKSRGPNRHKLLTQFLQVFVPTMYAETGVNPQQVDRKIDTLTKQNKKLEEEFAELQKKKSGKCCNVM